MNKLEISQNLQKISRMLDLEESDEDFSNKKNLKNLLVIKSINCLDISRLCERCGKVSPTIVCEGKGCFKAFHENCAEYCCYKLKLRDSKKYCHTCLLKEIYEKGTWIDYDVMEILERAWLDSDTLDNDFIIPQKGDTFYFIPQAYEEFIAKCFRVLNFENHELVNPAGKIRSMQGRPGGYKCTVKGITYEFPKIESIPIKNKFRNYLSVVMKLEMESLEDVGESFFIRYFPSEYTFLIWHDLYQERLDQFRRLRNYSKVFMGEESYNYERRSGHESLYQCMKLTAFVNTDIGVKTRNQEKLDEDDNVIFASPWDICVEEDEAKLSPFKLIQHKYHIGFDEKSIISFSDIIEAAVARHYDEVLVFYDPVNKTHYPDYKRAVHHEMNIRRILNRLKKKYYRSIESLFFDIDLIASNAALFNGPVATISHNAKLISKYLKEAISVGIEAAEETMKSIKYEIVQNEQKQEITEDNNNDDESQEENLYEEPVSKARVSKRRKKIEKKKVTAEDDEESDFNCDQSEESLSEDEDSKPQQLRNRRDERLFKRQKSMNMENKFGSLTRRRSRAINNTISESSPEIKTRSKTLKKVGTQSNRRRR